MIDKKSDQQASVVAVVNDDEIQLMILSALLRRDGLEARTYVSAEQALAELENGAPPDLIVTDLHMPGIDGWRFCRLLRSPEYEIYNAIPILVISATFVGDEPMRITKDIGANAFLPAPVDAKVFIHEVRSLLSGKRTVNLPRVIIIEDNRTPATQLESAFKANGYHVTTAITANKALEYFRRNTYDAAIIDYHLPDQKGDELLCILQKEWPDCACVMMTTDPNPGHAIDWMKKGAAAYLRKPFEPDYLVAIVSKARRERALLRLEDLLEQRTRELIETDLLYHTLFDTMTQGVIYEALNGEILSANPAAERILGMSFARMKEKSLEGPEWDCIYPDGSPYPADQFPSKVALRTGEPIYGALMGVYNLSHKEYRWISIDAMPEFRPEETIPYRVYTTFTDITERKKAEDQLNHHREMEHLVMRISSRFANLRFDEIDNEIERSIKEIGEFSDVDRSYVFLFDDAFEHTSNSHEWCAPMIEPQKENLQMVPTTYMPWWMVKLKANEAINLLSLDDLPPEAYLERNILEPQSIISLLVVPMRVQEQLMGFLGFDSVRHPIVWAPETVSLIRMVADIFSYSLERKQVEDELIRSEESFRRQFAFNSAVMLLTNSEDGSIIDANNSAARFYGYTREQFLKMNISEINTLPSEEIQSLLDTIDPENGQRFESRHRLANGSYRDVEVLSSLIQLGKQQHINSIIIDITERKRAEKDLQLQRQLAIGLAQSASHEESLRLTLSTAVQISGMESGCILLTKVDGEKLDMACHVGEGTPSHMPDANHSVCLELIKSGQPAYFNRNSPNDPPLMKCPGCRPLAIVPIVYESHPLGCLCLNSQERNDVAFSARPTLESVAAHASAYIARAASNLPTR